RRERQRLVEDQGPDGAVVEAQPLLQLDARATVDHVGGELALPADVGGLGGAGDDQHHQPDPAQGNHAGSLAQFRRGGAQKVPTSTRSSGTRRAVWMSSAHRGTPPTALPAAPPAAAPGTPDERAASLVT